MDRKTLTNRLLEPATLGNLQTHHGCISRRVRRRAQVVPALIAKAVSSRDVRSGITSPIALRVKVLGCGGNAACELGAEGKFCGELIERFRRDHGKATIETAAALAFECDLAQLGKL